MKSKRPLYAIITRKPSFESNEGDITLLAHLWRRPVALLYKIWIITLSGTRMPDC